MRDAHWSEEEAQTYYSKRLAQHAVMEFTRIAIRASEIEVI